MHPTELIDSVGIQLSKLRVIRDSFIDNEEQQGWYYILDDVVTELEEKLQTVNG